jgi:iron complex outermembrane recepter protein
MTQPRLFRRKPLATAICSILTGTVTAAHAQTGEEGRSARVLEEIIVTAARREQSILDVPYNISAVSGAEIAAAHVTDSAELMRAIPGVAVVDRGYRNSGVINGIMIRGLNVDGAALGDYALNTVPTVSTYINDTPIYANFILKDIERVEVLRGPQGTLYGSGSLGGTVRYIMNAPDPGGLRGQRIRHAEQHRGLRRNELRRRRRAQRTVERARRISPVGRQRAERRHGRLRQRL